MIAINSMKAGTLLISQTKKQKRKALGSHNPLGGQRPSELKTFHRPHLLKNLPNLTNIKRDWAFLPLTFREYPKPKLSLRCSKQKLIAVFCEVENCSVTAFKFYYTKCMPSLEHLALEFNNDILNSG